jgi:hypothetical protein
VRPIGKGSRFLVLSGLGRGLEVTVTGEPDDDGVVTLDGNAGSEPTGEGVTIGSEHWRPSGAMLVFLSDLEGPCFKRLDDAPAEVDPLFAEIAAAAGAVDMEAIGGAGGVVDELRHSLTAESDPYTDTGDWYEVQRKLFVEVAAISLAGIRAIDGR